MNYYHYLFNFSSNIFRTSFIKDDLISGLEYENINFNIQIYKNLSELQNIILMRNKLPEEKKKKKASITIDANLLEIFEDFITDKNIKNKSKYIESLIRKDMEERGEDTKREF